jgi:hypothetical protein
MTTLGSSTDSFIVEESGIYYVVETVRKYSPGEPGPDGYDEIDKVFKAQKRHLKAVRVKYEVRALASGHQA